MRKVAFQLALALVAICAGPVMAGEATTPSPSSCGEIAVRVLAGYFGRPAPRETVQKLLHLNSNEECSLVDVENCLRELGIESAGFGGKVDELRQCKSPMVLLMKQNQGSPVGHFLVAKWNDKNQLMAYDLTFRLEPYELTYDSLRYYWSGVGLVVYGTEAPTQNRINSWAITSLGTLGLIGGIGLSGFYRRGKWAVNEKA